MIPCKKLEKVKKENKLEKKRKCYHRDKNKDPYKEYKEKYREKGIKKRKIHRKENKRLWKEFIVSRNLNICIICGYSKCFAAIEYHHIVGRKEHLISDIMYREFTLENIEIFEKEMAKCVPLCANCHREVHTNE